MENFTICFKKVRDYFDENSYYEWEGLEEYHGVSSFSQGEEKIYFAQIKEIKKVILRDIRKIMDYRLQNLRNNASLMEELQLLLDTYDNEADGIDTTFFVRDVTNFMILTDSYLCFNNIENKVEDDDYFRAYGDVDVSESIIVINRNFKNYYFITMTTNILTSKTTTTLKSFTIKKDEVSSYQSPYKGYFAIHDYSEKTPQKIIKRMTNRMSKVS